MEDWRTQGIGRLTLTQTALHDVFGVKPGAREHSYVDRGRLDEALRYALAAKRVVVIHGDSKQGKTWLRQQVLPAEDCVAVQCQLGATPASLLQEALGLLGVNAVLRLTSTSDLSGSMDLSGSGELGLRLLAKLRLQAKARGAAGRRRQRETVPIGRTPGHLAWVAGALIESGRRLVVEDFHYLDEKVRKQFAFLLKALGDYGVHPVVIGVWSQDHLLTYYNGDLSERVEDIHLMWTARELEQVLQRGGEALNVSMSNTLRQELIRDAYGNVGTLQTLAEEVCKQAGVYERQQDPLYLPPGPNLARARELVAGGMRPRFQNFADAYVAGMRHCDDTERCALHAIVGVVCEQLDDQLLAGVTVDALASAPVAAGLTRADLLAALGRLERFQSELEISPLMLTYNRHAQTVGLIDRRFLFYRKYGTPRWPWDEPDFSS